MSSEMTKHAAVSSVNCGLKVQPRALKKSIDLSRSFTGRLMKILVLTIATFVKFKPRTRARPANRHFPLVKLPSEGERYPLRRYGAGTARTERLRTLR